MKLRNFFLRAATALSSLFIFLACDIGLGGAVDTMAPSGTITSPGVNAIIRDSFAIKGTWADDGFVGQITVNLRNTATNAAYTYNATIDAAGTWLCAVNPLDEAQPLTDGTYLATISIYDAGGHVSTLTRSYTIDNTAPVVILSYLKSADDTSTEIKTYGKLFTLSGKAADDNNINRIDVKVYQDQACSSELKTITKLNVPAAIEQDVAAFGSDDYTAIYGSSELRGSVSRYCKVFAYDDAQRYPVDGSEQSESDKLGNCQTSYYFQTTIEKLGLDKYKTNDLYAMFNGTYSNSSSDAARAALSADEISAVRKALTDSAVHVGTFALNPKNNPTFTVIGLNQMLPDGDTMLDVSKGEPKTVYQITNGDVDSGIPLTINIAPGRDNYAIETSTLKMYFKECDVNGSVKANAAEIEIPNPSKVTSLKTKTISTVNFQGLKTDSYYKICVEGTDTKGNAIETDNSGIYAFYLAPINGVIELSVSTKPYGHEATEFEPNTNYISSTTSNENYKKLRVTFNYSYTGDKNLDVYRKYDDGSYEVIDIGTLPKHVDANYSYDIDASELTAHQTITYKLQTHENEGDEPSSYSRDRRVTIKLDDVKPAVLNSGSDLISYPSASETSNSSFRFEGKAKDDASGVNKVYVKLYDLNDNTKTVTKEANGTTNWTLQVIKGDTDYADLLLTEGKKKAEIWAVDKVGLESEHVTIDWIYKNSKSTLTLTSYQPDGDSDVGLQNKDLINNSVSFAIGKTFTLKFRATDNFGIKEITAVQTNKSAEPNTRETLSKTNGGIIYDSQTDMWIISNLPVGGITQNATTIYSYEFIVTDEADLPTESKILTVTIDNQAPSITEITLPGDKSFGEESLKGDFYIFKGKAKDDENGQGLKESDGIKYIIKKTGETVTTEDWNSAESAELNGENWSITKTLGIGKTGTDTSALYEGNYTLHIKAIDKADNKSEPVTRDFCIDQKAPSIDSIKIYKKAVSGTNSPAEAEADGSYIITDAEKICMEITATDTNDIKSVTLLSGSSPVNLTHTDGTDIWTSDDLDNEQTYNFTITVEDVSGRNGANINIIDGKKTSKPLKVIFDKTKPKIKSAKLGSTATEIYSNNAIKNADKWYNSKSLKLLVEAEDGQTGVSKVEYSTDATITSGTRWTELNSVSGAVDTYKETIEFAAANDQQKLNVRVHDEAGNISDPVSFTVKIDETEANLTGLYYKIGEGSLKAAAGTAYVNGSKALSIYGRYSDGESGIGIPLQFTLGGSPITPVVKYFITDSELDETNSDTLKNAAYNSDSPSTDNTKINYWIATYTPDGSVTGKISVSGSNGAERTSKTDLFTLVVDKKAPELKNINIVTDNEKYSVYPHKDANNKIDYYFINNKECKFTISAQAEDNVDDNNKVASGIDTVTLTIADLKDAEGKIKEFKSTNGAYFADIDLKGLSVTETSATLKVTDNAGNQNDQEYKLVLKFDTTAPKGIHAVDSTGKDLYFRVGEQIREDGAPETGSTWTPVWSDTLDKDVGGKYSTDSYGNAQTIKVRGTFDDSDGSDIKMIYYKVYHTQPDVTGASETNTTEYFRKNYSTFADGYFSPIKDTDKAKEATRRVFYSDDAAAGLLTDRTTNVTLTAPDGSISITNEDGTTGIKYYRNIESTFKTTIPGLTENATNYIAFVVVDNVGNAAVESVKVPGYTDPFSNYQINVDTLPPEVPNLAEYEQTKIIKSDDTNATITIFGTATDNLSGVDALTVKVNGKTITKKENTYGTITVINNGKVKKESDGKFNIVKTGQESTVLLYDIGSTYPENTEFTSKNTYWKTVIKNTAFAGISTGNTVTVQIEAKDKAGTGNSGLYNIGRVEVDTKAPEPAFTKPAANAEVNKIITLSGKITEKNGLQSVTLTASATGKTSKLFTYIKNRTDGESDTITLNEDKEWSIENIDTTEWNNTMDSEEWTLTLTATDEVGNVATAVTRKIKVNQDSDRPVITFSNITLKDIDANTAMTSTSRVWAKADTIYGSVDDDDGIDSVYVIESDTKPSDTDWSDTTKAKSIYSSGALEYAIQNGKKTLWFKVKDVAGGEFISSSETNPSDTVLLATPKLKDKKTAENTAENYYGYKSGHGITEGTGKNILATTVYVQVDTKDPEIYQTVWYTFDEALVTELKTATDTIKNEILEKPETHSWKVISSLGGEYIGGRNKQKIYIMYKAKDASGILSSTESFGGVSGTKEYPEGQTSPYTTAENVYYTQIVSFDLSNVQTGNSVNMVLRVTDRAKRPYEGNYYFSVDNEAPSIEIKKYSDNDSVFGSSSVSITGNTTENRSQIDKLYFAVTKIKDDGTPENPKDDIIDASGNVTTKGDWVEFSNYVSKAIWTVSFDTESIKLNKDDGTIYYTDFLNDKLKTLYGESTIASVDSKKICIWFYATDSLGNSGKSAAEKLILNVITKADIPSVAIDYPESSTTEKTTTVSSTIRISGTTDIKDTNRSVSAIWLQIDPDYNASTGFSASWKSKLQSKIQGKSVGYSIVEETGTNVDASVSTPGSAIGAGVLAIMSSQVSWHLTVNTIDELLNRESDTAITTIVAVRAYAVSDNGKVSSPSTVYFTIDPNAPHFAGYDGKENNYILVKAEDSNKKMKYTSGMWISGKWLLKGSVTHSTGIKTLTAGTTALVSEGSPITFANGTLIEDYTAANGDTGWKFTVPVGTGFARQNFDIVAVESASSNNSKLSVSLQYDDTAPTNFSAIDLNASDNTFVQANGTLSLTGRVDESGSGLARNAFYFTRDYTVSGTTTRWFIDPMLAKGTYTKPAKPANFVELGTVTKDAAGKESFVPKANSGIVYNETDGLYWRTSEGATISSNVLTVTSLPDNVRTGGLCKINNVIYRMESVSGTSIKIDSEHEVEDTATGTTTTVYFALAQVIDNFKGEGGKTKIYGEAWEALSADDGDWMVEKITLNGSTYTWTGSINSKNILDGNVDLHFSYFDNAGNVGTKSYSGMVCNNAPRLAGVTIATDYNGDGKYGKEGEKKSYWLGSSFTSSDGKYATRVTDIKNNTITVTGANNSAFKTVKGDTEIRAEIIGGNGTLSYTYNIGTSLGASTNITGSGNDLTFEGNAADFPSYDTSSDDAYMMNGDYIKSRTATIKVPLSYFSNYGNVANATNRKIENSETNSPTWFQYVIWDETDGLAAGSTSQHATMNIALAVQVHDSEEPTATIDKFYWKSLTDNSIYDSANAGKISDLKGHIELENDLPSIFTANSSDALYDKDPKVSGKIVVRGTAYDNIRLKELYVQFTDHSGIGSSTKAASYANGVWTSEKVELGSEGWAFSVDDGTYDENGHNAKWSLILDTEKLSSMTGTNKNITVIAKDERGTKTENNVTTTSIPSAPATYRVDVVPYITGIHTGVRNASGLKDSNIRSASGKYSVLANNSSNTITVNGFNFKTGSMIARIVNSTDAGKNDVSTSSGTSLTIAATSANTATITNSGITKSGYLELFSNGIRALNNVNGNDSRDVTGQGSAIGTAVTDYKNYYNREADYTTTKNVQLTDDRYLRFFDMKATTIKNGYYPNMIMDGNDPVFGYVDLNGINSTSPLTTYQNQCYQAQRTKFSGSDASFTDIEYLEGAINTDQMVMAKDSAGKYIHATVYNYAEATMDVIYNDYAEDHTWAGYYYTDGWAGGTGYSGYGGVYSTQGNNNAIALETTSFGNGTLIGRYQNLRMAVKGNSTNTTGASVYMAYYDDNTTDKDIIFRTFKIGTNSSWTNTLNNGNKGTKGAYSNLADLDTNGRKTVGSNASKYLDLGVTSGNIVVIVYYDMNDSCLKLKYSNVALDGSNTNPTVTWTNSNVSFPSYVGTDVSLAIDSNNGIHIAAFDANDADLVYMYMPSCSSSTLKVCRVDQASSVGTWTRIALKGTVPYIAYYNSTDAGSRDTIKLAYFADTSLSVTTAAENNIQGCDSNGYTTGKWEYMTVPAITPPQGSDSKFKQVNLDFDTAGNPVVGYLGTTLEFGKWFNE